MIMAANLNTVNLGHHINDVVRLQRTCGARRRPLHWKCTMRTRAELSPRTVKKIGNVILAPISSSYIDPLKQSSKVQALRSHNLVAMTKFFSSFFCGKILAVELILAILTIFTIWEVVIVMSVWSPFKMCIWD